MTTAASTRFQTIPFNVGAIAAKPADVGRKVARPTFRPKLAKARIMLKPARLLLAGALLAALVTTPAFAIDPAQKTLFETYNASANGDVGRGKAFFHGNHTGGKAETPSCTSCHTSNLAGPGKTRAGKAIDPMAASVAPKRYTDRADVEKWFRRNCTDVLGRECSAQEKSDVLAYLLSL